MLKNLGPEKEEAFFKLAEGFHAWETLTSEGKHKIIETLEDFVEETKAQRGRNRT